jgi:hypothetical protein
MSINSSDWSNRIATTPILIGFATHNNKLARLHRVYTDRRMATLAAEHADAPCITASNDVAVKMLYSHSRDATVRNKPRLLPQTARTPSTTPHMPRRPPPRTSGELLVVLLLVIEQLLLDEAAPPPTPHGAHLACGGERHLPRNAQHIKIRTAGPMNGSLGIISVT